MNESGQWLKCDDPMVIGMPLHKTHDMRSLNVSSDMNWFCATENQKHKRWELPWLTLRKLMEFPLDFEDLTFFATTNDNSNVKSMLFMLVVQKMISSEMMF